MNFFIKTTLSFLLLISSTLLQAADGLDLSAIKLQAHLLASQELNVSGEFSKYDFAGVESAFDWTFTASNGEVYQLQGKAPTDGDVFGWEPVTVTPNKASWYMSYLGDWDGDGESKFDWVLMNNGVNAVYKLSGVTESGNFAYSSEIDVPYTISGDKTKITFGDETTPQLSVTFPTSGEIVARVEQTNGSDYMDYYGTSIDNIIKIVGQIDDKALEILINNEKITQYQLDNIKITYEYLTENMINTVVYIDSILIYQGELADIETQILQRTIEECNKIMKDIIFLSKAIKMTLYQLVRTATGEMEDDWSLLFWSMTIGLTSELKNKLTEYKNCKGSTSSDDSSSSSSSSSSEDVCTEQVCGDMCIPISATCCGGDTYCANSGVCCTGGGCCPAGTICCGSGCCPTDTTCCGSICCSAGTICLGDRCCKPDEVACGSQCMPAGNTCCETYSCPSGYTCSSTGCTKEVSTGCSGDFPQECNGECISADLVCCGDHSCAAGMECCGSGCMTSGYVCVGDGVSCEPDMPQLCGNICIPAGAVCCPDGIHYCPAGYTCGPNGCE